MNYTMDGNTLFAIIVICITICAVAKRIARSVNISNHGWPPEHVDADGDAVESGYEEERKAQ